MAVASVISSFGTLRLSRPQAGTSRPQVISGGFSSALAGQKINGRLQLVSIERNSDGNAVFTFTALPSMRRFQDSLLDFFQCIVEQ